MDSGKNATSLGILLLAPSNMLESGNPDATGMLNDVIYSTTIVVEEEK